jgi:hypothetical protein
MAVPAGEDVIERDSVIACEGRRGCTKPARHRCPNCKRPLCNGHAKKDGERRSCCRCRRVFAREEAIARGEPVPNTACGAIHVDRIMPTRLHNCAEDPGHEGNHKQMHSKAGACGFPCCAGMMWDDPRPEDDELGQILGRISAILDGMGEDEAERAAIARAKSAGAEQTSLFDLSL